MRGRNTSAVEVSCISRDLHQTMAVVGCIVQSFVVSSNNLVKGPVSNASFQPRQKIRNKMPPLPIWKKRTQIYFFTWPDRPMKIRRIKKATP